MRKYLVGFLGLALISCSDSPTQPATLGESGSLSFSFTGAGGSGTYSAIGAVPAAVQSQSSTFGTTAWAAADLGASSATSLDVFSAKPQSSTTWDFIDVEFAQQTVGTFQISSASCSTNCNSVSVAYNTSVSESNFSYICTLASGSVTLTSKSATRAVGSFTGTGTCITPTGVSTAFTVSNGVFDVGIFTGTL